MKNLKYFCKAVVLTTVLAIPGLAGEMSTGVIPPSPPSASIVGQMDTGIVPPNASASSDDKTSLTDAALGLLQSLLSVL